MLPVLQRRSVNHGLCATTLNDAWLQRTAAKLLKLRWRGWCGRVIDGDLRCVTPCPLVWVGGVSQQPVQRQDKPQTRKMSTDGALLRSSKVAPHPTWCAAREEPHVVRAHLVHDVPIHHRFKHQPPSFRVPHKLATTRQRINDLHRARSGRSRHIHMHV